MLIQTEQGKAALGSPVDLKNVSLTGSTDVYFGPSGVARHQLVTFLPAKTGSM